MSRDELLHNAVLFLLDPKVRESSLTSRITFLEGKGLNETEIQEALRRAGRDGGGGTSDFSQNMATGRSGGSGSGETAWGGSTRYRQGEFAPTVPRRDWRDVFVS